MKKYFIILTCLALLMIVAPQPINTFAIEEEKEVISDSQIIEKQRVLTEEEVISTTKIKLQERINLGFLEFEGLEPGKIIPMRDQNHNISKALVELVNTQRNLSGYMIVDKQEGNPQIVEFALGDVHPLIDKGDDIYYVGPLTYLENFGNGILQDLKTKQKVSEVTLSEYVVSSRTEQVEEMQNSSDFQTTSSYSYKIISAVPDYQQNDNDFMENDCVPTSAANVLMYWDAHGYSNISASNNWKALANLLGTSVYFNHDDDNGVVRSMIVPGLKKYLDIRGYGSSFSISRDTSPTFSDLKTQINNGNPSMLSVNGWMSSSEGHNITLVGFEELYNNVDYRWYRSVIVRDNWENTPKDVWFLFGNEDIDDLYKIVE